LPVHSNREWLSIFRWVALLIRKPARQLRGHALAAAFATSNSISAAQPAASPLPAEAPSWFSARIEEEENGLAARRSVVPVVLSPEGEFFRSFSDPGNPQTAEAKRPGAAAAQCWTAPAARLPPLAERAVESATR
jgi:hypothetical protein